MSRDGSGRFVKGVSGNVSGRPRTFTGVVDLARAQTTDAIETLVRCMGSKDDRVRVAAAQALLDRAWGRPAATEVHGQPGRIAELQVQKLEAEIATLNAKLPGDGGAPVFVADSDEYRRFLRDEWGFDRAVTKESRGLDVEHEPNGNGTNGTGMA